MSGSLTESGESSPSIDELMSFGSSSPESETGMKRLHEDLLRLGEESKQLRAMLQESDPCSYASSSTFSTEEEQQRLDERSVYVGNVDYGTKAEELVEFFKEAGEVAQVTIAVNKYMYPPRPLGYAYVAFLEKESVSAAIELLSNTMFRGRLVKISPKRTNIRNFNATPSRGGRPRGRGGYRGRAPFRAGYRGKFSRGSYRSTRGRGGQRGRGYHPYFRY